jgi:sugar lactone lactonase YvrE
MLWVCSFDGPELEGHKKSDTNASGVFQFNLDTGKLIRKWVLDTPGEIHGFNDVALTRGNDAYITHMMKEPAIYRITQAGQKLEVFAKPEGLEDPNGITLSADEKTLFVAGNTGVFVIDVATKKSRLLTPAEGDDMRAIDGLYFYRGNLLGIRSESVNLYHLDESSTRVVMVDVVEQHHPLMNIPTTGVLVGDDFYYVANSQLNMVNSDGSLATEKLTEPPILKLKLR